MRVGDTLVLEYRARYRLRNASSRPILLNEHLKALE
jgi:hypothetical protein